jgi:hypothetical protein
MTGQNTFIGRNENQHTPPPTPGLPRHPDRSGQGFSKVAELFGIDLRSLALFRIVLGFIVLIDLAERFVNLGAHYSDAGILPRETAMGSINQWRWSLGFANGTTEFQALLFIVATAAAILLILGVRTRVTSVILWVLVLSIQVRNPLLSSAADTLIRMLLFWAMFLPLDAKWSLGAPRAPGDETLSSSRPAFALSFGTAGLLLQIACMYLFTALLKTGPAWTTDGTAIYYSTGAGHVTRPFADVVHQLPPMLLEVMTYATLVLEYAAPVLLFFPFRTTLVRTFTIVAIVLLHIGILSVMDVGIFSQASALCMVCFLPGRFWDVWLPAIRVRLVGKARLPGSTARGPLRPLVNDVTRAAPRRIDGTAVAAVSGADHVGPNSPSTELMPEDRFPQRPTTANPAPGFLRASPLGNVLAAFCILFVVLWNITTVSAFTLPRQVQPVAYFTGMYQTWNMFAPNPPTVTQWYVIRGVLMDGREVDLLRPMVDGRIDQVTFLSWERPDDIVNGYYQDKYWRKYFEAIGESDRSAERKRLADIACRTWNRHYGGDVELNTVEIYQLTQRTLPEGERGEINRYLVDDFVCLTD